MSTQISPEELHALVGESAAAGAGVESRDFRQPRRLSPEQLARLKRTAQRAQQELGRLASTTFRAPTAVEIASVGEASVPELVRALGEPFAALLFDCGGQPCWTLWDTAVAVNAAERMLGATENRNAPARALTTVERALVQGFLHKITGLVAASFGLEAKNPRYLQDFISLYAAQDAQDQGDPQRLCVQVALQGEYGQGTVRVYLHGVRLAEPAPAPAREKTRSNLPAHLSDLPVELSAELGSIELPLQQLLALEPGDVIPLDVAVGGTLNLYVEDEACGSARWGERSGRIALRITDFRRRGGESR